MLKTNYRQRTSPDLVVRFLSVIPQSIYTMQLKTIHTNDYQKNDCLLSESNPLQSDFSLNPVNITGKYSVILYLKKYSD